MQAAIHLIANPPATELLSRLAGFGANYALFGDRLLIFGAEVNWEELLPLAAAAGLILQEFPIAAGDNPYLVIQTGALFQKAYPDVPVILNASRYLAVAVDPDRAKQLKSTFEYRIERLEESTIVFDIKRPPPDLPPPVPWIKELLKRLNVANLKADLEFLTSLDTRYSTTPFYAKAVKWAEERFDELGYAIYLDPISIEGKGSQNVVASKPSPGKDKRDIVLVVAHLDSKNYDNPEWSAPGADDNGSGTAGLLEIARLLKDYDGRYELQFVLFGGEEDGLYGSDQFVKLLSWKKQLQRVRAVVCMDMIATVLGDKPGVLIEGPDISQTIKDGLAKAAFTYSPNLTVTSSIYRHSSDHLSFLKADRPAVLTIEGNGNKANENIHTANDTLTHINYELMMAILRMNTAFVAELIAQN